LNLESRPPALNSTIQQIGPNPPQTAVLFPEGTELTYAHPLTIEEVASLA